MKKSFFILLSLLLSIPILGKTKLVEEAVPDHKSIIKGNITDSQTGEPLIGVSVFIPGTVIGVSTDLDGNFFVELEPGKYTIKMTLIGYQEVTISELIVSKGKALNIQQKLIEDSLLLGEVVIKAKMSRNSEVSAIVAQQNSMIMLENLSSDELRRKGISNVEEGLTKVAGISKQATRGIVVRGLGDRYNNVLLNGLPMPSLDPDKKSLPMSMFPTSVIKTLNINKSYLGKLYGDFAGATVDIETKDTPQNAFFNMNISTGMNSYYMSGSNQKLDDLKHTGYFGVSKHKRDFPNYLYALSQIGRTYKKFKYPFVNTSILKDIKGAELFDGKFTPSQRKMPVDYGISFSGGKTFHLSDVSQLGFVTTANFAGKNTLRKGFTRILNAKGAERKHFDFTEWGYATKLNALLSLTLDINHKHRLSFNNLYLNNSKNTVNERYGDDFDSDIFGLLLRRSKYVQNDLYNGQILGTHEIGNKEQFFLDWGASYAYVESDEPDTKDVGMIKTKNTTEYIRDTGDNGGRYFSAMKENQYAARIGLKIGLGASPDGQQAFKNYLNIGYNLSTRNRDLFQISLAFNKNSQLAKGIDYTVNPEYPDVFLDKVLNSGAFFYQELRNPEGRNFEADQTVHATYLSYEKYFGDKLSAVWDIRMEKTNRTTRYVEVINSIFDPFTEARYTPLDILSGLNLNYKLSEESNIRFAVSKTVTRPGFRETTKSVYRIPGIGEIQGNPNLTNSTNYNWDLKYELFPQRGELLAINAFGKYLKNPIERIAAPSASGRNFTFSNVKNAKVYGVEIEMIKNLGNLFKNELFRPFTLGLNGTLMTSVVKIDKKNKGFLTNSKRELQGASPFLVNADLTYDKKISKKWTTKATLIYNVFGKRIYAVGGSGIGDFIEQSQHTIDFIWNNKINKHLSVGITLKDILDTNFKVLQEGITANSPITEQYNNGRQISVKLNYKF